MKKCQTAFDNIKELLITPLVFHIPTVKNYLRLESDTNRIAARGALSHFQQGQWVLTGQHSKNLLQAIHNYSITELAITGF